MQNSSPPEGKKLYRRLGPTVMDFGPTFYNLTIACCDIFSYKTTNSMVDMFSKNILKTVYNPGEYVLCKAIQIAMGTEPTLNIMLVN